MSNEIPGVPDEEDEELQEWEDEMESQACEREAAAMRRAEDNFGY
ncbi:hypothetical protein [Pseudomonas sp. Irchel 3F3]|nr:hypothetical protein [Pseudomonas sp. Irchel 3F3]